MHGGNDLCSDTAGGRDRAVGEHGYCRSSPPHEEEFLGVAGDGIAHFLPYERLLRADTYQSCI